MLFENCYRIALLIILNSYSLNSTTLTILNGYLFKLNLTVTVNVYGFYQEPVGFQKNNSCLSGRAGSRFVTNLVLKKISFTLYTDLVL